MATPSTLTPEAVEEAIDAFAKGLSEADDAFDRLSPLAHSAAALLPPRKAGRKGGYHAGSDDKHKPEALVRRFWVAAVYHGIHVLRGLTIEQFIADELALKLKSWLDPIKNIARFWGDFFCSDFACYGSGITLQKGPAKSLLEQLSVAAEKFQDRDDFLRAFHHFWVNYEKGGLNKGGRHLTDTVTAATVQQFLREYWQKSMVKTQATATPRIRSKRPHSATLDSNSEESAADYLRGIFRSLTSEERESDAGKHAGEDANRRTEEDAIMTTEEDAFMPTEEDTIMTIEGGASQHTPVLHSETPDDNEKTSQEDRAHSPLQSPAARRADNHKSSSELGEGNQELQGEDLVASVPSPSYHVDVSCSSNDELAPHGDDFRAEDDTRTTQILPNISVSSSYHTPPPITRSSAGLTSNKPVAGDEVHAPTTALPTPVKTTQVMTSRDVNVDRALADLQNVPHVADLLLRFRELTKERHVAEVSLKDAQRRRTAAVQMRQETLDELGKTLRLEGGIPPADRIKAEIAKLNDARTKRREKVAKLTSLTEDPDPALSEAEDAQTVLRGVLKKHEQAIAKCNERGRALEIANAKATALQQSIDAVDEAVVQAQVRLQAHMKVLRAVATVSAALVEDVSGVVLEGETQ